MLQKDEEEKSTGEMVDIDPNVFIQNLLYAIEGECARADRNSILIPVFFIFGTILGYYISTIGV